MFEPDLYLGTWELVPELSLYDFGPLPASCTYVIEGTPEGVSIDMRWTMTPGGPSSDMRFAGPIDGSRRSFASDSGSADPPVFFSLTRVDARTLDSRAFRNDVEIAYARRVASEGGDLLAIVQEGQRPDGGRFRNFQVYRRARPAPGR
jgi:hypothetical protein